MKKSLLILFILLIGIVDIFLAKKLLFDDIQQKKEIHTKKVFKSPVEVSLQKKTNMSPEKSFQSEKNINTEESKSEDNSVKKTEEEKIVDEKNETIEKTDIKSEKESEKIMIAKEFVNLRKEPDINSEVLTIIRKGDPVKIIGTKGKHWKNVIYRVKDKEFQGWVDDRFFIFGGNQG